MNCDGCGVRLDPQVAIEHTLLDGSVKRLCLDCHRKSATVEDWPETFARAKETDELLLDPDATWEALEKVRAERGLQDARWGDQSSKTDLQGLSVEMEELGEVARALNDNNIKQLKEEVIQVAAVAVVWLEALNRREERKKDVQEGEK